MENSPVFNVFEEIQNLNLEEKNKAPFTLSAEKVWDIWELAKNFGTLKNGKIIYQKNNLRISLRRNLSSYILITGLVLISKKIGFGTMLQYSLSDNVFVFRSKGDKIIIFWDSLISQKQIDDLLMESWTDE